jgi:hypothetical protein
VALRFLSEDAICCAHAKTFALIISKLWICIINTGEFDMVQFELDVRRGACNIRGYPQLFSLSDAWNS